MKVCPSGQSEKFAETGIKPGTFRSPLAIVVQIRAGPLQKQDL